ncbi:MAG: DEAD/DEAH box helicase [Candidatus Woesearchaeota archaeon]|nr:MAG: DEAD/DEAH box helicase [Candidatus Woesearchaeota archaeon]
MATLRNFTPRLYQETILETCSKHNCLVVLPTGLGKTKTAILSIVDRLNKYPNSKALFLTPTKPLADQICKEIKENTDIQDVFLFTGEVSPGERESLWKGANVIIGTPQAVENDLINNKVPIIDISILILDEAHNAVGNYSYTWIAKQYMRTARYPRIIGLTASPGSDLESIQEICRNLYTEDIEVRTEESPDVKPYVQDLEIEYIKVELPERLKEVKTFLENSLKSKLNEVKELGLVNRIDFSKSELISLQSSLQGRMVRGERDFQVMKGISLLAEAIKVDHALVLLETQGVSALKKFINKLKEEAIRGKVKATKNLVNDLNFRSAAIVTDKLINDEIEHPKLDRLLGLLKETITKNTNAKVIIFNNYRDGAVKIQETISKLEGIHSTIFVGQIKKGETGLTQKKQIEILDQFKEGLFNVLIATSVAEQGLDIPQVDLVIFYEPIPSAIRSIQRRGRTARQHKGKVVMLITKNTRDEVYFWVSRHKENRMYKSLEGLKERIKGKMEKQPTLKEFEKEKLKVFADSRETGDVVKQLIEQGIEIESKRLDVADFIISNRIGIERKSVQDFVNSIIDKRLLQQIKELKNNFESPLIILEGEEDIYSVRNIHQNAIRGMLSAIVIDFKVPIIWTKSPLDTAAFIKVLAKREQDGKDKDFGVRFDKKPLTTKEQQEFIVESLPGVGPTLAKSLLREFKSVKKLVNTKKEKLEKVENIGPKKAESIISIFEEDYKED